MTSVPSTVIPLGPVLHAAQSGGYAVGAFSPRLTPMIAPVLRAAERLRSPVIVQISQRELERYGITPGEFATACFAAQEHESITVPVVLHLDHTKTQSVIEAAIAAGFSSVMIDASEQPLRQNIAITQSVVRFAHARGVSVEAELGMIGTTDYVETEHDDELFTDPDESVVFVDETGVDALAVSVGTAHGLYTARQPRIDVERLRAIRQRTPVPLVLHGGSGIPAAMVRQAIELPGGGVSKMNIATELEHAVLAALGRDEHMTNAECCALPDPLLAQAQAAVEQVVIDKMSSFLGSAGRAPRATSEG